MRLRSNYGMGALPIPRRLLERYPALRSQPTLRQQIAVGVPDTVRLDSLLGGIYNQGPTGRCSSYSAAGCRSLMHAVAAGQWLWIDADLLFREGGGVDSQGGSSSAMLNVLQNQGGMVAATMPGANGNWGDTGQRDKIQSWSWEPEPNLDAVKQGLMAALALKRPCLIDYMISLPSDFYRGSGGWSVAPTVIDPPFDGSGNFGYHAMSVCGYDGDWIYVHNSWGSGWGRNGIGRISWLNFAAHAFCTFNGYQYNLVLLPIDIAEGPSPPPPTTEKITGYQDANGAPIAVAPYAAKIFALGQFTQDDQPRRCTVANQPCGIGAVTPTSLALTLPTMADGIDYPSKVTMVHGTTDPVYGPALLLKNPTPHPDLTIQSFAFDPAAVAPGGSTVGTLILSGPVVQGTLQATLAASPLSSIGVWDPKAAVYAGSDRTTVPITLAANAPAGMLTITATLGASQKSATIQIGGTPPPPVPSLVGLGLAPATVAGGQSATGQVTLSGPAPVGGVPVALGTDTPNVANTPVAVTVAAGATTAPFLVTTLPVTQPISVQIRAVLAGVTKTGALAVTPAPAPNPILIMLAPSQDRLQCVASFGEALSSGATIALSVTQPDGRRGSAQITLDDPPPPPVLLHIDRVTDAAGSTITRAAVGDKVTVVGGGFGGPQSGVMFAGVKVTSITSWNDSSIVVTVPATNQAADLTGPVVVTVAGKAVTSAFNVSIAGSGPNPPPSGGPTAAAIAPTHAAVGAVVTLTGSGFDDTCYLIFSSVDGQGRRATERFAVNATAIAAKVPAGAATGTVYVSRHSDGTQSNKLPFTVDSGGGGGGGGGATLSVSPSGDDVTGDGSPAKPFRSLAKVASVAPKGSVVLLAPGVWYESLGLLSGVSWRGAGLATLDGSRGGKSGLLGQNLVDVTLDGLIIQGFPNLGNVQGGKNFKLTNCKLFDGATSGFWMNASQDCEVSGNEIARCGTGIGDDCFSFASCQRILVTRNDVSKAAHAGIQFLSCQFCRIVGNLVHNCGSSGIIAKRGFDDGVIENNFVQHSAWPDESSEAREDSGIQVVGNRTFVRRNRVFHCGSGITISLGSDPGEVTNENVVELNSILDAHDYGIYFAGYGAKGSGRMSNNKILRNIVWGSLNKDFQLDLIGNGPFSGNLFLENVAQTAGYIEGPPPPFDTTDPQLDPATLESAVFKQYGWHPS